MGIPDCYHLPMPLSSDQASSQKAEVRVNRGGWACVWWGNVNQNLGSQSGLGLEDKEQKTRLDQGLEEQNGVAAEG